MTKTTFTSTTPARSAVMSRIRGKNTKPELLVRSLVHRLGYRYRVHYAPLPGRPDLAFPARKKVIFVHGCFWHRHDCTTGRKQPRSNESYWTPKLARNKERDDLHAAELESRGWDVLVLWECELGDAQRLASRLISFLGPQRLNG